MQKRPVFADSVTNQLHTLMIKVMENYYCNTISQTPHYHLVMPTFKTEALHIVSSVRIRN